MPSGDSNLREVGRVPNGAGFDVTFGWDLAPTISQADAQWFDAASESGFVCYEIQHQLATNLNTFTATLQPGTHWIRVNLHYPGFGTGALDRGWFPSNHIMVVIPGGAALATGSPASALNWNPSTHKLTWTLGVPAQGSAITMQAVDFSTFPNFNDILASPFINPTGDQIVINGLPFAVHCPSTLADLMVDGLPTGIDLYVRVNTLYGCQVWMPSDVLHFHADGTVTGGSGMNIPWWVIIAVGIATAAALYEASHRPEGV